MAWSERRRQVEEAKWPTNYHVIEKEDGLSFYVLGVFCSDGNVYYEFETGRVSITSVDRDWLFDIRDLLFPKQTVTHGTTQSPNLNILQKRSDRFASWLVKFGCVPAKSLTIRLSDKIPEIHFRDFIRGLIDGDGSVGLASHRYAKDKKGKYRYHYLYPYCSLVSGSRRCLKDIQIRMRQYGFEFGLSVKKPDKNSGVVKNSTIRYVLVISNSHAVRFLHWLYYQDDLFCLKRKYRNAKRIFKIYKDRKDMDWVRLLKEQCITMRLQGYSHGLIAHALGIQRQQAKNLTNTIHVKAKYFKIKHSGDFSQWQEARVMREQGYSMSMIAEKVGLPEPTLWDHLKHVEPKGLKITKFGNTGEKRARIHALRKEGKSLDQIVKETGYKRSNVKQYLSEIPEFRATAGKRMLITDEMRKNVMDLKKAGVPRRKIAEKLSMNEATVKKIIANNA